MLAFCLSQSLMLRLLSWQFGKVILNIKIYYWQGRPVNLYCEGHYAGSMALQIFILKIIMLAVLLRQSLLR